MNKSVMFIEVIYLGQGHRAWHTLKESSRIQYTINFAGFALRSGP